MKISLQKQINFVVQFHSYLNINSRKNDIAVRMSAAWKPKNKCKIY